MEYNLNLIFFSSSFYNTPLKIKMNQRKLMHLIQNFGTNTSFLSHVCLDFVMDGAYTN